MSAPQPQLCTTTVNKFVSRQCKWGCGQQKSGRGSAHFEVLLQTAELEQGRLHVCDHDIMGEVDKVNVHIWHHVLMSVAFVIDHTKSNKVLKVLYCQCETVSLCLCKGDWFSKSVLSPHSMHVESPPTR